MSGSKPVPRPEQIHAWLSAHGWTPESPLPDDPEAGIDFTYKERADDGDDIWVRAPRVVHEFPYYNLAVDAVISTAAWIEKRTQAEVRADMIATEVAPSVPAPPAVA